MTGSARTKPTNILLVDDHPVVRQGLRRMLEQERDLRVQAEAASVAEALASIEEAPPDLAIVDIALGTEDGLQLVKQINARWPAVLILVVSMHTEQLYAERALRAGAHGYVMKHEPPETLVDAVHRVSSGGVYISEGLQSEWLHLMKAGKPRAATPLESLTDRELAVFRLIGHGLSTREIAKKLHLSVKTVETYRENIKEKLGLRNATELVQKATLWLHAESTG
jgi:DNA-binding NarL/FixJ family response regulator